MSWIIAANIRFFTHYLKNLNPKWNMIDLSSGWSYSNFKWVCGRHNFCSFMQWYARIEKRLLSIQFRVTGSSQAEVPGCHFATKTMAPLVLRPWVGLVKLYNMDRKKSWTESSLEKSMVYLLQHVMFNTDIYYSEKISFLSRQHLKSRWVT